MRILGSGLAGLYDVLKLECLAGICSFAKVMGALRKDAVQWQQAVHACQSVSS
jgi:hypothetical protein